ncbi:MAG: DUF3419 family protein [Candidatus Omnitrophota bacterium]|jgi:S-adenosylmethionine-diacylglycerol 3-amino-3-carboxypropyl transferase|nr:MAG: DUF3419 family protein [Candidatus Omnitrophota bacterium]
MNIESGILIKRAVEFNSILCKQGLLERLFSFWFDGFVYNQIWEDPRVDLEALEIDSKSKILTIASGGCNLLNYLIAQPHSIQAVDLNRAHLHLTKLKLAAMRHLPNYDDFFSFFGYANRTSNPDNYHQYIRPFLDEDTQVFWENNVRFGGPRIRYFAENIYNFGTMGYFIRILHALLNHCARDPRELLAIEEQAERAIFFQKYFDPVFDHWVLKILSRIPLMLYSLGIPPQQFNAMKNGSNGKLNQLYCERLHRLICQFPLEDNYFAWQALSRGYDCEHRSAIPDYLKEEHYQTIKSNLHKISLRLCSTTQFLKEQTDHCLNRYVFLDSLDWMNGNDMTDLWREIRRTGKPGSRIIFRTASHESPVEQILPSDLRQCFHYEENRSHELFQKDRSAIYGGFHLYVLSR